MSRTSIRIAQNSPANNVIQEVKETLKKSKLVELLSIGSASSKALYISKNLGAEYKYVVISVEEPNKNSNNSSNPNILVTKFAIAQSGEILEEYLKESPPEIMTSSTLREPRNFVSEQPTTTSEGKKPSQEEGNSREGSEHGRDERENNIREFRGYGGRGGNRGRRGPRRGGFYRGGYREGGFREGGYREGGYREGGNREGGFREGGGRPEFHQNRAYNDQNNEREDRLVESKENNRREEFDGNRRGYRGNRRGRGFYGPRNEEHDGRFNENYRNRPRRFEQDEQEEYKHVRQGERGYRRGGNPQRRGRDAPPRQENRSE